MKRDIFFLTIFLAILAPPLALKMRLFYIKSTTCPLYVAHSSPDSSSIYYNVFLCIVMLN